MENKTPTPDEIQQRQDEIDAKVERFRRNELERHAKHDELKARFRSRMEKLETGIAEVLHGLPDDLDHDEDLLVEALRRVAGLMMVPSCVIVHEPGGPVVTYPAEAIEFIEGGAA